MSQFEQMVYNLLAHDLLNFSYVTMLWTVIYLFFHIVDFFMIRRFHKAVLAEIKQDKNAVSYLDMK